MTVNGVPIMVVDDFDGAIDFSKMKVLPLNEVRTPVIQLEGDESIGIGDAVRHLLENLNDQTYSKIASKEWYFDFFTIAQNQETKEVMLHFKITPKDQP